MTQTDVMLRCPECKSTRAADASSCQECGLLFVGLATQSRRKSDSKRASDLLMKDCPACLGDNEENALKCRSCGEILDSRYRVQKTKRLRAQINHASWVAYFLGVLTLFILQPVGMVAIGAGLVLSIAYYAIRVEEPDAEEPDAGADDEEAEPAAAGFVAKLKRQWTPEQIVIKHPRYPALRTALMGTPLLLAGLGWLFNYSLVQTPTNDALSSVARLANIEIDARYASWLNRDELILEFDDDTTPTPADLRDSIVQISRGMKDQNYKRVIIEYGGQEHTVDGELFRRLGLADPGSLSAELEQLPEPLRPLQPTPSSRITIPIR